MPLNSPNPKLQSPKDVYPVLRCSGKDDKSAGILEKLKPLYTQIDQIKKEGFQGQTQHENPQGTLSFLVFLLFSL